MKANAEGRSVVIVSVPSEVRKNRTGQLNDPERFKVAAENLANRLNHAGKNTRAHVFSTLGKQNLESVLRDVAKQTGNQYQKIYFIVHGNEESLELHNGQSIGPQSFAEKLIHELNWKTRLEAYLNQTKPVAGVSRKLKPLVFDVRMLACLTGRKISQAEGNTPESFASQMLNCISGWLKKQIALFATDAGLSVADKKQWQFEVQVRVKAPRGWNVVLQDGHNISYWVPDAQASRVDRQFARQFDDIHSKAEAHKKLGSAVMPEDQKTQVNLLKFSKYANQKVLMEIDTP